MKKNSKIFYISLAFFYKFMYNQIEVIPLIASLISNPNTPFEQNRLLPCSLFCFYLIFLV